MKGITSCLCVFLIGIGAMPIFVQSDALPKQTQLSQASTGGPYHDHPPNEALPATLDPAPLRASSAAFVTYTLAAKIKAVLYQEPCFCPCDKEEGHRSLLDCFKDNHSVWCPRCQAEVIFCYRMHVKGQNPEQIRDGLRKGEAWKFDLKKSIERLYAQLNRDQH